MFLEAVFQRGSELGKKVQEGLGLAVAGTFVEDLMTVSSMAWWEETLESNHTLVLVHL